MEDVRGKRQLWSRVSGEVEDAISITRESSMLLQHSSDRYISALAPLVACLRRCSDNDDNDCTSARLR